MTIRLLTLIALTAITVACRNATELPSLVNTGRSAIVAPVVSGVGAPPAIGTDQM